MSIGSSRKDTPVYERILVATDGSPLSGKAVSHAIDLARRLGAELIVFHASPDYRFSPMREGPLRQLVSREEYEAAARSEAEKILDAVRREAQAASVACTTTHDIVVAPWQGILEAARKSQAEAIVMGSHGRSALSSLWLGSETQKVLGHATVPVTVVR